LVQINLQRLCRRLDYTFHNIRLLKQALTHCSAGGDNNERFEFLGDSILNFVIAHQLFVLFPNLTEGELSRLRASLVKGDHLAELATAIGLGDFLYLGQGELKTGGFRRTSILADAFEAVIAAVFFDGGMSEAEALIKRLFHDDLQLQALENTLKDSKTLLQEYLQSKKLPLPHYGLLKIEGEEHNQIFHVYCAVQGVAMKAAGLGGSRRKAEQEAARVLLAHIKSTNPSHFSK